MGSSVMVMAAFCAMLSRPVKFFENVNVVSGGIIKNFVPGTCTYAAVTAGLICWLTAFWDRKNRIIQKRTMGSQYTECERLNQPFNPRKPKNSLNKLLDILH